MTQPGLFLTLEGIDGAGKSSHIDALEALFEAEGRQVMRTREPGGQDGLQDARLLGGRVVTRTREPGGTPLAEMLRTMILTQPMDPLTESLLVFAARRDHIVQVIEPALARGDVVLCDRFTDATFAYQGAGRGFDTAVLSTLEHWVQARDGVLLQPTVTLWFDLPPETAAERLAGARLPDKFESQPVEFFRRVAAGYAERAASAPRFVRIDANRPREQVWQQIEAALAQRGLARSKP